MANYLRLAFTTNNQDRKDELVALLSDAGFEGFEETQQQLLAYIPEEKYEPALLNALPPEIRDTVVSTVIPGQNWNAVWEQSFQPVLVNRFCAVRAAFHEPVPNMRFDIIVTPKMSFGTGHHATTYLMIEALEKLDLAGKNVLDFGTGTGVLAILAQKLGAAAVDAIDNDDWSIDNAAENFQANECTAIHLQKADQLSFGRSFDLILANINKNVILGAMGQIKQHLTPGGVVLLSGLLEGDQPSIAAAAAEHKLLITAQMQRDGWILLQLSHF